MSNKSSNHNLKVDMVIGTLLWSSLAFFLWDEMLPGQFTYFVLLGTAFIIGIFMLVRRNMTGKDLVGLAALYALAFMFFGTITLGVFNGVLNGALGCHKGQFMSNPDGSTYRSVPHFHRRMFHCDKCTNPHLSHDNDDANQPEQTYR